MGGIWGWTIPAHWVTLSNGEKFNTCPNAGICAGFCYAKNGTYMFPEVIKAHTQKLEFVLFHREEWKNAMVRELRKKKYYRKLIRIHDAGDFFSLDYALDWVDIMVSSPQCFFYAYTKQVSMFKNDLRGKLPGNFRVIFSFGGREDNLIDREKDRHSDVFPDYEEMIQQGYNDIGDNDAQAALARNFRVGLFRNNIPHLIKKMGNKRFSDWQKR